MAVPKPRLDVFKEGTKLFKKCRTSTPVLRPPKPPSKNMRRHRMENNSSFNGQDDSHETSFSFNYSRLFSQFDIMAKIGSGDFGEVFKVKSLTDGKFYAIKRTSISSNSDRVRKLQEVRNHQTLPAHPNCVGFHDSWEEDGFLYIQTELCKTSLNQILGDWDDNRLPEQLIWEYLLDLLLAVKHLHDHDLIHMDIKPDNIFISFDDTAKLGDFGLMCSVPDLNSSKMVNSKCNTSFSLLSNTTNDSLFFDEDDLIMVPDDEEAMLTNSMNVSTSSSMSINNNTSVTTNNNNCDEDSIDSIDEGDSKYLASETMQGKFTKAADIFSLGITIFEIASGLELPKQGKVYHKLRHNEIEESYFNGLSEDLVHIIKIMMEEDYSKRPTIEDLLQLDSVRARRYGSPITRPSSQGSRNNSVNMSHRSP